MIILKNRLQDIYYRLLSLLSQMGINNLNALPSQIGKAYAGENKIPQRMNNTLQEITENDLKGITSIGVYAFYNCDALTSVTIPDSVTIIGDSAFWHCDSLTNIYLYRPTPPALGDTGAIPSNATIHVPVGSGDAYRGATNWSNFADKIVEDIVI